MIGIWNTNPKEEKEKQLKSIWCEIVSGHKKRKRNTEKVLIFNCISITYWKTYDLIF